MIKKPLMPIFSLLELDDKKENEEENTDYRLVFHKVKKKIFIRFLINHFSS